MQSDCANLTPVSLTIFDVSQLEDTLQNELKSGHQPCVDLQHVTEMDAAGVQWLISVKQRHLKVERANKFCLALFNLMGLEGFIGAEQDGSS